MRTFLTAVVALSVVAGCQRCAPKPPGAAVVAQTPEPGGGPPDAGAWPAGPLRAREVTLAFGLHRPRGQTHIAVRALVREQLARLLPAFELVDQTDLAEVRPAPSAAFIDLPPSAVPAPALQYFGRNLDPALSEALGSPHPTSVLLVRTKGADGAATLKGLTALVADVGARLGLVVEDAETRLYWEPKEFSKRVALEGFDGPRPLAAAHVTVHSSQRGDGLVRSVTLGMSKLGLPDLVVQGHTRNEGRVMLRLLDATAQTLVETAVVPSQGLLEVDLRALQALGLREQLLEELLDGGTGRATLTIAVGTREEGDAENDLMELSFEGPSGSGLERQSAVLSGLFGRVDSLLRVKDSSALVAASAAARSRLLELKPLWLSGGERRGTLTVKAPFDTKSGGTEWMWVEVREWKGTTVRGVLVNEPFDVPGLKAGATVEAEEGTLFDYLLTVSDGGVEGNETRKLIEAQQGRGP